MTFGVCPVHKTIHKSTILNAWIGAKRVRIGAWKSADAGDDYNNYDEMPGMLCVQHPGQQYFFAVFYTMTAPPISSGVALDKQLATII